MRLTRRQRRHCPHIRMRGIYGDEINHTPGYRRLQCTNCGQYLDGPVGLAQIRVDEFTEAVIARHVARTAEKTGKPNAE